MEIAATITNPLFALSVELRPKDSSSIPTCAPLLPALLASLLQSLVIRPILRFVHRSIGLLVLKLQESSCPFVVRPSALLPPLHSGPAGWLQQALGKVAAEVGRILLSEQTSLWGLYLLAPHLFDVKFELNVEIGMLRAMLCLLLTSMGRLLMTGGLGHQQGAALASAPLHGPGNRRHIDDRVEICAGGGETLAS